MVEDDYFPFLEKQSCNGHGPINLNRDFGFDWQCSGDKPTVVVFASVRCAGCYRTTFEGLDFYNQHADNMNFAVGLINAHQGDCDNLVDRYDAQNVPVFFADMTEMGHLLGYEGFMMRSKIVVVLDENGQLIRFNIGSNDKSNYADLFD